MNPPPNDPEHRDGEEATPVDEPTTDQRVPLTKPTNFEDDHPRSNAVLTEETALRPPDDAPHPAERPADTGREYVFARFDEDGADDATQLDPRAELADLQTHIIQELPTNPFLECSEGPDAGRVFTLQPGLTTVGRAMENDVILTDVAASRKHFTLTWADNQVRIRDLGSGNGTRVNEARVYDAVLKDTDVIAAGETRLSLRIPALDAAGAVSVRQTVRRARTDDTDPLQASVAHAKTIPQAQAHLPVSVRLESAFEAAGAWARTTSGRAVLAAAFLVVLAGLAFVVFGGSGDTEHDAAAEQAFQSGVKLVEAERWQDAREAFETAQRLDPEHPEAGKRLAAVLAILADDARLAQARALLGTGRLDAAEQSLASIKPTSPLQAAAAGVRREIADRRQVRDLVARGQRELAAGHVTGARMIAAAARKLGVEQDGVDELERAIEARAGRPSSSTREERSAPPRPAPAPTPREVRTSTPSDSTGDDVKARALSLYGKGDFAGAQDLLRQSAAAPRYRDSKTAFTELAERIERFGRVYGDVDKATGASRIELLRSAVLLDRGISGGQYAKRLEGPLIAAYLGSADTFFSQGNTFRACESVRQAAMVRATDARVQASVRKCESAAKDLVSDAVDLDASEASKARDMLRKAMLMVPPSSPTYKDANRALARLARSNSRDDDE